MPATLTQCDFEGFTGIRLANDRISLTTLPDIGGKIASLRNERTGREWLWRNPNLPLRLPEYGADYSTQMDSGGWDEILPTVGPCQLAWGDEPITLPDHGEVVGLPWRVTAQADAGPSVLLGMTVDCRALPLRLERRIRLGVADDTFLVHYRLENRSDVALPWFWAAHPLLQLEAGMHLTVPRGTTFNVASSITRDLPERTDFVWPDVPMNTGQMMDLSVVPNTEDPTLHPFAAKLFSYGMPEGEVAVATAGGERLLIDWDPQEIPYVGLWINYHGWSGAGLPPCFNLGVEPTTTPCETLKEAMSAGFACWLGARDTWEWRLRFTVG